MAWRGLFVESSRGGDQMRSPRGPDHLCPRGLSRDPRPLRRDRVPGDLFRAAMAVRLWGL